LFLKNNDILHLRYLFLREIFRKRRTEVVAQNNLRRIEAAKRRQELLSEGKPPTNYPGYSSIFRHLGRQQEKYLRDQLLLIPARLGEIIVIDCGFEQEHAREHYLLNLVDQVQYLYAEINQYHSPSFVYLCNLSRHGRLQAEFDRRSPLENLSLEATESSYLDIFPKEKLIYLSPDSNVEMTSFDHDAVYIIGGIIDLSRYSFFLQITKEKHSFFCICIGGKKPLTFGKAKRENIRHQRLPIDRYVKYVLFNRNSILLYK
jgi:ribonuclease P protein 1